MRKRKPSTKGPEEILYWGSFQPATLDTGERRLVFVANAGADANNMKEAGYRSGQEVAAMFKQDRNLKNYRQAHALAKFVGDNTDEFPGLNSHQILKEIQRRMRLECDSYEVEMDFEGLGVHVVTVYEPRSLNFARMSDEMWRPFYKAFIDYCCRTWFRDWDDLSIEEWEEIMRGNQPP